MFLGYALIQFPRFVEMTFHAIKQRFFALDGDNINNKKATKIVDWEEFWNTTNKIIYIFSEERMSLAIKIIELFINVANGLIVLITYQHNGEYNHRKKD